ADARGGAADSYKVIDLAASSTSEEDKIKAVISQSSSEYDSSRFVKRPYFGPPPATYVCQKCQKPGHWIQKCPNTPVDKGINRVEVKRSTGIPRSFMMTVDDPTHRGVMISTNGEFVIPRLDAQAYLERKIEKPPFVPDSEEKPTGVEEKPTIPEELQCSLCHELLCDAVLIPCCGSCFCDECVRQALLDSDHHECPICHELDQTPDKLIPNRFLRNKVARLKGDVQKRKEALMGLPPVASTSNSSATHGQAKTKEEPGEEMSGHPLVKQPLLPHPDLKEGASRPDHRLERRNEDDPVGRVSVSTESRRPPLLSTPGGLRREGAADGSENKENGPGDERELREREFRERERPAEFRDRDKILPTPVDARGDGPTVGGFREREDRWPPPRWQRSGSREPPREYDNRMYDNRDNGRRRFDWSPPRFRGRGYRDFSPRRGAPPRHGDQGADHVGDQQV
ncbi:hypothetical protein BIW11_09008, partial [Tropilaelaps mercedesae]